MDRALAGTDAITTGLSVRDTAHLQSGASGDRARTLGLSGAAALLHAHPIGFSAAVATELSTNCGRGAPESGSDRADRLAARS